MAKPLIVGNWKSYITSLKEAKKTFKDIEKRLPRSLKSEVVICPPSLLLYPLVDSYKGKRILFGVQDTFFEAGAHTGELPATLAKDVGASYTLVGHAERRAQGETDEVVSKEVGAALDAKLVPIVAVGEKERDKDGRYLEGLRESILTSLSLVDQASFKKIIIAYEPVWAIGAPLPPSPRAIRETIIFIRKVLTEKYEKKQVMKTRILYGGAVSEDNVEELKEESDANGFLLGRASLDPEAFSKIVSSFQ